MTLAKGHHAQTRRTARNFFSHDSSMPNKTVHYYFFTGEDDIARFDSRRYNIYRYRFINIGINVYRYIYSAFLRKNKTENGGLDDFS
jgi:hypothetical protein